MIKIVLVDDEPLIVKGLESIMPEFEQEIEVVGTAQNGAVALEKYGDQEVDVLLTDIQMPVMNGLELIDEWKKRQPSTKMVVLSGFEDFHYIKRGLSAGIENYLLKPLNEQELKETLIQIEKKQVTDKVIPKEEAYYILRDNTIWRWLHLRINKEEWEERLALYDMTLGQTKNAVLIQIQPTKQVNKEAWKLLSEAYRAKYSFMLLTPDNEIILGIEELTSLSEQILAIQSDIKTVLENEAFYLFVSEKVQGEVMYPQAFRQLTRLLPERLVQESGSLIAFHKRTKHTWRPKRKQYQLAQLLVMNNEKEIKAWIRRFFQEWLDHKVESDPHQMLHILNELLVMLAESDPRELSESMEKIAEETSIEGLEEATLTYAIRYYNHKKQTDESKSPIIQNVLTYIKEHFAEGMSLKTLGNDFHINAVYLGQLFQKEMGEHFTDYLNRYRVNYAKEELLLTQDNLTIIASKSGYTDMAYFYRQFKKHTGETPNRYRKIHQ
ncbi:response regulator transcription factor [Listeria ivanovii]|uniref:Response regulator transcription factor n=2 Tax=Listeria ivanovii TaxID=1638 RepID=A0ABS1G8B7_LISIV|nr:response regulator transcription factor [Listeria ivanovii]AIS60413.1 chemotaxis protein CheY [Listeria ivanovii subsp. londoniensis]AIS63237.1 chemotaxis protein CheY [Listeria ivanovii subsp. londoniensis]MBK1963113.1 response regulator transcription factor [Listeria ivanovii subsp. londoniensis]MBK1967609.1 response regulator transcription factor [Listeria ivanovii subsp. londoniensis]MBK1985817.1 response regulator transcription factor [Listeria ivanovii subsp. londoniensis]